MSTKGEGAGVPSPIAQLLITFHRESFMLRFLQNIEEFVSSTLLGVMTVVIIVQVIFRYFISYSLAWPEELGRYLFVASVYIGSSYVEQHDKHLAITILRTNGGAFLRKWLPMVVRCVNIAFSGLMALWGVQMVVFMYKTNQLAPAIEVPMYIVYASIPLGMAGMAVRSAINLVRDWRGMEQNSNNSVVY